MAPLLGLRVPTPIRERFWPGTLETRAGLGFCVPARPCVPGWEAGRREGGNGGWPRGCSWLIPLAGVRALQVPGDEGCRAAGHGAVGHVQPLHQLRAIDHGHDQFLPVEQGTHPLGQPVLADDVEGLRQFMTAFVDAVAAGLGVGLAFSVRL